MDGIAKELATIHGARHGIAGLLNIIWGIAGVSNSKFFTENSVWVVSSLHTWGWITLIIGVIQIIAAFSLFSGGGFGRVLGIIAASIGALVALAGHRRDAVLVDLRVRPVRDRRLPALQVIRRGRDVKRDTAARAHAGGPPPGMRPHDGAR